MGSSGTRVKFHSLLKLQSPFCCLTHSKREKNQSINHPVNQCGATLKRILESVFSCWEWVTNDHPGILLCQYIAVQPNGKLWLWNQIHLHKDTNSATHIGLVSQFFHLWNGNTDAYHTGFLWMLEKIHLRRLKHCLMCCMCSANKGSYHRWISPNRSLCMNSTAFTTSCHTPSSSINYSINTSI